MKANNEEEQEILDSAYEIWKKEYNFTAKDNKNSNTEPSTLKEESATQEEPKSDDKVELNTMIASLVGVVTVAMVVGIAIGAVCIMCIMNRCKKNQNKRLQEANKLFNYRGDSTANVDMLTTNPIQQSAEAQSPSQAPVPVNEKNGRLEVIDEDKIQDTEDIQNTQDNDEDFGHQLTSRGLTFKAPAPRRGTEMRKGVRPALQGKQKADFTAIHNDIV